jgi:hypothetical protein
VIRRLLVVLDDAGIVRCATSRWGDDADGGYRLDASALLWRADAGEHGAEDRVRKVGTWQR